MAVHLLQFFRPAELPNDNDCGDTGEYYKHAGRDQHKGHDAAIGGARDGRYRLSPGFLPGTSTVAPQLLHAAVVRIGAPLWGAGQAGWHQTPYLYPVVSASLRVKGGNGSCEDRSPRRVNRLLSRKILEGRGRQQPSRRMADGRTPPIAEILHTFALPFTFGVPSPLTASAELHVNSFIPRPSWGTGVFYDLNFDYITDLEGNRLEPPGLRCRLASRSSRGSRRRRGRNPRASA
jgi:hypothetical protein